MSPLEDRLVRLEGRIVALESSARLWRLGAAGAALLGVTATLMAQAPPPDLKAEVRAASVTTREINLVDEAGKVRVEIGVDKDGAGLDVRDSRGKLRLVVGEGPEDGPGAGTGVWVFDDQERPRVGVGLGKNGAGLVVLDENGKAVAGQGRDKP